MWKPENKRPEVQGSPIRRGVSLAVCRAKVAIEKQSKMRVGLPRRQGFIRSSAIKSMGAPSTLTAELRSQHISFSLAEILVLAGAGRMAHPTSTRIIARLKCVQEHVSPIWMFAIVVRWTSVPLDYGGIMN